MENRSNFIHAFMTHNISEQLKTRFVLHPSLFGFGTDPSARIVQSPFNSLRPRLKRRPFADDIFKCIFLIENEWILPRISMKFVLRVRINNIPALVQIMAWRRPGDKPLSEPIMVSLLTHICVTRPQWVNAFAPEICGSNFQNIIFELIHYSDVIEGAMASQSTSLIIVYSTVCSAQRKHQSSASLVFVRELTVGRWIPRTKGR